jgi:Icc protein
MLTFAHISDTHFATDEALDRARRIMAYLRPLPLDLILVTGDIADHGAPAEYEQAREVLTADVPVLLLPGNHDRRDAYRSGLLGSAGDEPVNAVHEVGGVLFVLCDSSIPGRNEGALTPDTLDWLRAALSNWAGPALVCLHHPPVRLHHELLDDIRLRNAGDLADLLADFPRVLAVLCGHAHSAAASTFADRPLIVAPGVVSTLRLPFTIDEPLTWLNTTDYEQPPGIAFHVLDDDGRLTTHFRVVT